MIFIFRKYNSQARIIIYAETYLESKELLFSFDPWADKTYNILEYKMYEVDKEKYADIIGIDKDMISYPRVISEKEFLLIKDSKDILLDEQFKNLHNTKILTKGFAGETSLMSTSEFVNKLKENADAKNLIKRQIKKMLTIVGDIWKLTYITYRYTDSTSVIKGTSNIYGLSRLQVLNKYNEQQHKQKYGKFIIEPIIQPNYREVFELDNNDFSQNDIDEYNTLVNYMKKYNIKKFPFDTREEDLKIQRDIH